MILAGYDININDSIKDIFTDLIELNANNFAEEPKTVAQQIACIIMLAPTLTVLLNDDVNQKMQKSVSIAVIIKVCKSLEKCNLVIIKFESNTNGRATKYFEKVFIENFDLTLINAIQTHGIDLEQFKIVNSNFSKISKYCLIY